MLLCVYCWAVAGVWKERSAFETSTQRIIPECVFLTEECRDMLLGCLSLHPVFCSLFKQHTNKCTYIVFNNPKFTLTHFYCFTVHFIYLLVFSNVCTFLWVNYYTTVTYVTLFAPTCFNPKGSSSGSLVFLIKLLMKL